MKSKKRFVGLFISAVVSLSVLSGCGDKNSMSRQDQVSSESSSSKQTTVSTTTTNLTTTTTTTTASTTSATAPAVDNEPKTLMQPMAHTEKIQVGEKFAKARQKADEIEKRFGIRLFVGNEVKNAEEFFGSMNLVSAENDADDYTINYYLERLDFLKEQLERYPKGFFDHFRSDDGKKGLYIAVTTGNIYSNGDKSAGATTHGEDWYAITMNMYSLSDNSAFNHELWHATEFLIFNKHSIDTSKWDALNPSGFSYGGSFHEHVTNVEVSDDTLLSVAASDNIKYDVPYFAFDYSRMSFYEDRATLIETVFSWSFDDKKGKKNGLAEMNKYPHIKAKLDMLAQWAKLEFGYAYWEEIVKDL